MSSPVGPAFVFSLIESADDELVKALCDGSAMPDPEGIIVVREGKIDFGAADLDPHNPTVIASLRQAAALLNKTAKTLEEERTMILRRKAQ